VKILLALHKIIQPGGIIDYTEHLAAGLKEIGHEVVFRELVFKTAVKSRDWNAYASEKGEGTGYKLNQKQGWSLPASAQVPYFYDYQVNNWREFAEQFDLVVWLVPCPTKNKENKGNHQWPKLYWLDTKQIAIVHDGNLATNYPWVMKIADSLEGVFCVHGAAEGSILQTPLKYKRVNNPMPPYVGPGSVDKRQGFVAIHNFKPFKKTEELIRAIPYMPSYFSKIIGGGGIEYHYMTSKEKVKKQYMDTEDTSIWESALACGMEYTNFVTSERRNFLLQTHRVHVDPQWHDKLAALGSHYNRTTLEAIRFGSIPMGNVKGIGVDMLQPGIHYLQLDRESYEGYGGSIVEASNMHDSPWYRNDFLDASREVYKKFERDYIAHQFESVAYDMLSWNDGQYEWSNHAITRTEKVWEEHFLNG